MPSSRADRWARGVGLVPALLLVTACGATPDADPGPAAPSPATASAAPSPTTSTAATDGQPSQGEPTEAMHRALVARSAAVSAHDLPMFLAGLDHSDPTFVARQRSYFDAFRRLPAGSTLALSLQAGSVRPDGAGYLAVVNADTQIAGFDALPVAGRRLFRFTPAPERPGELLVEGGDAEPGNGWLEPWETMRVDLRISHGVLGVFDDGSAPVAESVMSSAKAALADVATAVPYDWSRTVVVYALGSPAFLSGLSDVPGGDPLALDAVSFPVRSGDGRLAATRIALHPRTLGSGPEAARSRDRLLRHEMVHVAVGEHDDRAPLWLSEGIAEYLSVQSLAPEDRTLSRAAVRAARTGLHALPADDAFTGLAHEASYGISWWACEALVASYGELALWQLLDAYAAAPADAGTVLAETLGIDEPTLAAKAGRLMLAHYGRD
jgi:hypothetical protein